MGRPGTAPAPAPATIGVPSRFPSPTAPLARRRQATTVLRFPRPREKAAEKGTSDAHVASVFWRFVVFASHTFAAWSIPPPGFMNVSRRTFAGSVHAVAPDGKVAVGTRISAARATVKVYAKLPTRRRPRRRSDVQRPCYNRLGRPHVRRFRHAAVRENPANDTVYSGQSARRTQPPLAAPAASPMPRESWCTAGTIYAVSAQRPGDQ